jgi:hypothetical protein
MPSAGGFSQTAINQRAGARTQLSELATVGLAVACALFLGSVLSDLPQATLGCIVIIAVLGLIDPAEFVEFWRLSRLEFWIATVTAASGLVFGLLPSVLVGVLLTLLLILVELDRVGVTELQPTPGDYDVEPAGVRTTAVPGLLILRFDGPPLHRQRPLGQPEDRHHGRAASRYAGRRHRWDRAGLDRIGLAPEPRSPSGPRLGLVGGDAGRGVRRSATTVGPPTRVISTFAAVACIASPVRSARLIVRPGRHRHVRPTPTAGPSRRPGRTGRSPPRTGRARRSRARRNAGRTRVRTHCRRRGRGRGLRRY